MAVDLSSFLSRASSINNSRSIYMNRKGEVKDEGAIRTLFTRKNTFRATANEFLNALENEFGQDIGDTARELLSQNVLAGKPLKGSVVKECVMQSQQNAMRRTLEDLTTDEDFLQNFVSDLTNGTVSELNAEQAAKISQCFLLHHDSIMNMTAGRVGHPRQVLIDAMQKGEAALLKRSIDLITGNQNSPLVRLGYPNENDPQMVEDKLQVLNMLQTFDGPAVSNPMLIQAMTGLKTLRAANPAPGEFTAAELFKSVFPEHTTPTMTRPSDEEISLYTPNQLLHLFDKAVEDFTDNFTPEMLPENSPLKGTPDHTARALQEAKGKLFMPDTIANLSGDRLTLTDLPQIQFDITVNSKYDTLEAAVSQMAKDIPRRGTMGLTPNSLPPTITFQNTEGQPETVTVGKQKFENIPEDQLTEDQKAYNKGDLSTVSHDLLTKINSLSDSPKQAKAIAGCLNQSGIYPMWHAMKSLGDFAYLREHCAHNHTVSKNADGAVDVTINTSPDLKSLVGTATMTYHIDVDGRTGITDFQWDKPTLQERKDGIKNCAGYSQSIPSRISSAIRSLGLTGFGAALFSAKASAMLNARVDAAATAEELPSFESIRDTMPPGNQASPVLANLAAVAKNQMALRFFMTQPEENREAFAAAAVVCLAKNDGIALALIQDFMPQLKELHDNGNLNPDTAWKAIFNEDMPESARLELNKDRSSPFSSRSLDKFTKDAPDAARAMAAYGAFYCGFKYDTAIAIKNGEQNLTHITLDMMRADAGLVANDINRVEGMENIKSAEDLLGKDLIRMNKAFGDKTGKLQHIPEDSTVTVNLPSGNEGAPAALTLDPLHPQGLTPEQQAEYNLGRTSSVTADIRERITNFCGKDHPCQITNTILGMTQSGRQFIRDMPGLLNIVGSEHCQANISVFADDQKNLHVRYENLEHSALKFNYEFSFDPNGGQTLVALDMHRADIE